MVNTKLQFYTDFPVIPERESVCPVIFFLILHPFLFFVPRYVCLGTCFLSVLTRKRASAGPFDWAVQSDNLQRYINMGNPTLTDANVATDCRRCGTSPWSVENRQMNDKKVWAGRPTAWRPQLCFLPPPFSPEVIDRRSGAHGNRRISSRSCQPIDRPSHTTRLDGLERNLLRLGPSLTPRKGAQPLSDRRNVQK
jgi:hypothetical protein